MEINISDMIFAAINFLVMAVILNNLLFQPVMNILDTRAQKVVELQDETKLLQKKAEDYQSQYKIALAEANKSAQEIIHQAAVSGEKSQVAMIDEAKVSVQEMLAKARWEIGQEKEKMKYELRDDVKALVVMAAGKLLNRPLSTEAHDVAIQEFIEGYINQTAAKENVSRKISDPIIPHS